MKSKVLEDGAKFLRDRLPCVDPCKPMREDHGYEASNGDFYASYICTMQFENSVKEVYDILLGYFSSIEISVSEKLGNITVREDDDSMAPGITTNRMVSTTIGGLRMESNTVYFSRYDEGDEEVGHQNGYGIFVADYVDEDKLNPYHPHERIRRDFSTVLELTSYPIKHGLLAMNRYLAGLDGDDATPPIGRSARLTAPNGGGPGATIQSGSPLQDVIYLTNDEQSRRDTLEALKPRKLEKALRFMKIRRPKLDPCNAMGEERRYEAENGDFCSTRFTVTQFEEARSVKQVFDLLLFYFCNIEISVSEKIGHITIREDDGGDDKGIVQNRLVSTTHKHVKMESNTVMFSQYYDGSIGKRNGPGDSSYGLIIADFVDEDEWHPYLPDQRVRRDVNAVLEIREFIPQRPKSVTGGLSSRKPVIVLSRWVQNRMHYPCFPVCTDGWYELRNNMDLWGRALHRTIVENLRPRS
ncbi:hypothetical protein BBJ29_007210 [Phytophthora kernoviae]|uniref:Uncharacterized protein n=1 Tax=Phytophthora kernoviae TaxID=325452 RepID=A0A3F2RF27_9STRA|nr:hypothetical protein BBP00_00008588 [Phytophthora kernoviae]RLN60066.1 hypothetical protein BBJ29_007210 [Phytophthora kernoviae]